MSKRIQLQMFPEAPECPLSQLTNRNGTERWYYLYKPFTDEMLVMDDVGNWAWSPRDTINNTPHLFNTRRLAKQARAGKPGIVVTRYKWDVK